MKILLDHCVDRRLKRYLPRHEVRTAREMGWEGLVNGALLQEAAAQFDVLLTVDRNLRYQQNLRALPLSVIVLVAESNRLESLTPLTPQVEDKLVSLAPQRLIEIHKP